MRIVCVPLVPNVSVVACDSQYALLTQPQSLLLEADQSVARFTSRALVLFIGYTLTPFADASENCTQTESLTFKLFSPLIRSHGVYGVPAGAVNVTST